MGRSVDLAAITSLHSRFLSLPISCFTPSTPFPSLSLPFWPPCYPSFLASSTAPATTHYFSQSNTISSYSLSLWSPGSPLSVMPASCYSPFYPFPIALPQRELLLLTSHTTISSHSSSRVKVWQRVLKTSRLVLATG